MNLINRQRDVSAICRPDDILPIGQAVIVRILNTKSENRTTNPPAVSLRYYRSVAAPPKHDGRAGMMRYSSRALPARLSSARGTIRAGFLNLFGLTKAARRLSCSLRQFCQEPRSRFTKSFESFSSVFLHAKHHGASNGREVGQP